MIRTPAVYNILTPSTDPAVVVADVLAFLEIQETDTVLLQSLLNAAISQVEQYTMRSLSVVRRSVYYHQLDGRGPVKYGPVHAATGDAPLTLTIGGANQTVPYSKPADISCLYGLPKAMLSGSFLDSVTLTYTGGYGNDSSPYPLPDDLKVAVLVLTSELYTNQTGYQPPRALPKHWRVLASPYRDLR